MSNRDGTELSELPEKHVENSSAQNRETRLDRAQDFGEQNQELKSSREKRAEIVERQVLQDMPDTARRRLDNAQDFHFASENEFETELRKREPSLNDPEASRILGFHDPRDNQAYVREGENTLETALHEKYHQKSDTHLSTRLNEGVTEYLAREKAGGVAELKNIDDRGHEIPKPQSDYEREVAIIRKLSATVGDDAIKGTYFEGKSEDLQNSLDRVQGEGAFDRLQKDLESRNYTDADGVFEKK